MKKVRTHTLHTPYSRPSHALHTPTHTTGNRTGEHEEYDTDIDKKVKKVKYMIKECAGEDEMPEIKLKGKPNKSAYKLEWKSPVFE